jgi:hypothetical protein
MLLIKLKMWCCLKQTEDTIPMKKVERKISIEVLDNEGEE